MLKSLTPREFDCIYWAAIGKTNKQIGEILEISPHTVSFHMANLSRKLKVSNRQAAIFKILNQN
ncbi:response regulator transcription factor [Paenalcaligenes niemegkensis]|uniref:response regulator transcription factor n=1 Tax=Paenalcaligenes niemegkensis TaxID=2895469 RepID=UPI0035616AB8